MDGESMSDWYTGSANTLIKVLVRGLFGINPTLNGLMFTPSNYFRSYEASCSVKIRNSIINVSYHGENKVSYIEINGVKHDYTKEMFIPNEYLDNNHQIEIKFY